MKSFALIITAFLIYSQNIYSQKISDTITSKESSEVNIPDSIVRLLGENTIQIDSLTKANSVLKEFLRDSQNETEAKEREIANLKRKIDELQNLTIKRLEASNDTLQRSLISMASNFLYIPYDEYSIEEIAIPAFLSTKETPAYTRYQNRLPLLENYKSDILRLVENLTLMEKDLEWGIIRNQKANEHLNNLQNSLLYQRYASYDDWENTYLGGQILNICDLLKSPSEQTSLKLKTIRIILEELLNNK